MNLRRTLLIVATFLAIVFGVISFGMLAGGETTAGACARCGDGVCAKSCENKYSCPQDCGGVPSTTAATR
jgi:hypothetical protein